MRHSAEKALSYASISPEATSNDAATYICAMAEPLRKVAEDAELSVVAYLLGMVIEESRTHGVIQDLEDGKL